MRQGHQAMDLNKFVKSLVLVGSEIYGVVNHQDMQDKQTLTAMI